MWSSYQEMYLNTENEKLIIDKRLEMVRSAHEIGIKPTARLYKCSKNVVKKWCKRYALYGIQGLKDLSRRPKHSPKRIKKEDIIKINDCVQNAKEKKKYITVNNVRRSTKITEHSDTKVSSDVSWKNTIDPFMYWQIDIKYLTDIDNLKPYFKKNNDRSLMKYQITARDIATGLSIVSYCNEKSVTYTKMFLENILYKFLKQFKYLKLKEIKVQTDNGLEFTNKYLKTKGKGPEKSSFTLFIEKNFKKHKTNPPACPTYDSDVETFHWSIERDCLAWDDIVDNETLIKYTTEYIERYNNSIIKTRGYSPLDKIKAALEIDKINIPKPQLLTV